MDPYVYQSSTVSVERILEYGSYLTATMQSSPPAPCCCTAAIAEVEPSVLLTPEI